MNLTLNRSTLQLPLIFLALFSSISGGLTFMTGNLFYLFNFGYIGLALSISVFLFKALPKKHQPWARRASLLLIGSYLLVFVGFFLGENLQIEGFWVYLLGGIFSGATIHYLVAKIFGTLVFNRGWCGWACWTAMVLELFPWKIPTNPLNKKLTYLRYVYFFLSLLAVGILYFQPEQKTILFQRQTEILWLAVGNLIYTLFGFGLAFLFKDNRAFCKYLCPIPVLQKVGSRFSLLKIEIDAAKCLDCKKCEQVCPMQIPLLDYSRKHQRIHSSECILCQSCIGSCPADAIMTTFKWGSAIQTQ